MVSSLLEPLLSHSAQKHRSRNISIHPIWPFLSLCQKGAFLTCKNAGGKNMTTFGSTVCMPCHKKQGLVSVTLGISTIACALHRINDFLQNVTAYTFIAQLDLYTLDHGWGLPHPQPQMQHSPSHSLPAVSPAFRHKPNLFPESYCISYLVFVVTTD